MSGLAESKRGGFGIGVEHIKTAVNLGTLWRSAYNARATFIFTIGRRYKKQSSDTTKAWRHIPLFHYGSVDEFRKAIPMGWVPIGIELCDGAQNLVNHSHQSSAVYILGPEDGSLSGAAKSMCKTILFIPSKHCLNVATAGSIVMYDRIAKESK